MTPAKPQDLAPTGKAEKLARECGEALDRQGWVGADPHLAEIIRTLFPLIDSALEAVRREERERCANGALAIAVKYTALNAGGMPRESVPLGVTVAPGIPACCRGRVVHLEGYHENCACDCHLARPTPKAPSGAPTKCDATITPDDVTYECRQPAGHAGEHWAVSGGGLISWPVAAPEGGETGPLLVGPGDTYHGRIEEYKAPKAKPRRKR